MNTTTTNWTPYDASACVEGFDGIEHDEETIISAWQYIIDSGLYRTLQGWYGRTAYQLIERGICHAPGESA